MPSDSWVDYHIVAAKYYFWHAQYIIYWVGIFLIFGYHYWTAPTETLINMHNSAVNFIMQCPKYLCPHHWQR
jgi:hypothetical protein